MTARRLAFAAGVAAASCSPSGSEPAPIPLELAGLLERVAEAPTTVAFAGERRWTSRTEIEGAIYEISLRERVSADGGGRFALETLDVEGDLAMARDAFLEQQRARAGFAFHYRDFAIRDLALFRRNYEVKLLDAEPVVAGRRCAEFQARRVDGGETAYRVAADAETGLVLRVEERAANGDAAVSLEYESLDLAPILDAAELRKPDTGRPVDLDSLADGALGFEARLPRFVPAGFELAGARLRGGAVFEGQPTLTLEYQDGVECVFVAQGDGLAVDGTGVAAGEPSLEAGADSVAVWSLGPWSVVQGRWRGQHVVGFGKLGRAELLEMVESTLP